MMTYLEYAAEAVVAAAIVSGPFWARYAIAFCAACMGAM